MKKIEFQEVICGEITLRKFYNLIARLMEDNGIELFFDWADFKRWNGQIRDCAKGEFGTFKFITEWNEFNSSYVYYLDEQAAI